MPLQNRVTPFGEIVATPARGLFMGNRGIIHDCATKKLLSKRWSNPAWIICVREFRGRRRDVMATRSWTELFFLDEATALAAGHRPCFYCRRDDANRFRAAWCAGNQLTRARAAEIDVVLHRERLDGRAKRRHPLPRPVSDLPDGAMVATDGEAFLVARGAARRWSFDGYRAVDLANAKVELLTPPSTLRAIVAGYAPVMHPSADAPGADVVMPGP
ncbi:MAG: hypothetical protein JWR73_2052 [Tardiphaga sp.]|nr:hypothetical protein [Tardiphaga sp.]